MSSSQFMEKENSDGASSMKSSYVYQVNQIEEELKENDYKSSDKSSENKDNEEMDIDF